MSFAEWTQLSRSDPELAALTCRRRIDALPPDQQKAMFAWLAPPEALAASLRRGLDTGGPLAGIPYLLKDLFSVRGVPTRAGSAFLHDVRPAPTANGALVTALDQAGAALAGATHLHEFAYGLTGENPHYGDVVHPRHPDRTSGGSSSGSAAAVAAGIVPLALGTDTGGSVRLPAAFCGLYGLRLAPHHAWIADAFPLSRRFDTAGWFTATPEDMFVTIEALIGKGTSERPLNGVYLGFDDWVEADPDVARALGAAAERYAPAADSATRDELLAGFRGATQAYAVLQSIDAFDIHRDWLDPLKPRYGADVWQRIDRGRRWTATDLETAHIKLTALHLLWSRFFLTFDFLVLPATPFPALRKTDLTLENRNRILALATPASLGGLPVLTLPVPLESGLTSGLQVVVSTPVSPAISWILAHEAAEQREKK